MQAELLTTRRLKTSAMKSKSNRLKCSQEGNDLYESLRLDSVDLYNKYTDYIWAIQKLSVCETGLKNFYFGYIRVD